MVMACFEVRKDEQYRWNREANIVWSFSTSSDADDENDKNVFNVLHATDLLRSETLTIESLYKEPFSLLSMKTMSAIRDDSYDCGLYDFSMVSNANIRVLCFNELMRYKSTLARFTSVHCSYLRGIVLLSLFSPHETIQAIVEHIFDTTATEANIVSSSWDALIACGKALSYQTREGSTLLCSAICKCLCSNSTNERNDETEKTERLTKLISKILNESWDDYSEPFSLDSCINSIVKPLIKCNCTRSATSVFITTLESNNSHAPPLSSITETASPLVGGLCRSLKFENRLSTNSLTNDRFHDCIDENVRYLEKIAQYLPIDALRVALRASGDDLTWFVVNRMSPYIVSAKTQEEFLREEYSSMFQAIQACKGQTCVEPHERMIILCATAPLSLTKLDEVCEGNLLNATDHEIGKWLAALIRQQHMLTSSELYQLLTGRLGRVLWAILPGRVCSIDKKHTCTAECANAFVLQLSLRAVVLFLRRGYIDKQYSQNNNAALRICRAVRRASESFLQFEADTNLNFLRHVACVRVLLQFSAGVFEDESVKGKYYDSCVDIITMTVLENVKCLVANFRAFGSTSDIQALTSMIETFKNDFGTPKVCAAVLQVLRR